MNKPITDTSKVELANDKYRVRIETKLNNGGTQHE